MLTFHISNQSPQYQRRQVGKDSEVQHDQNLCQQAAAERRRSGLISHQTSSPNFPAVVCWRLDLELHLISVGGRE